MNRTMGALDTDASSHFLETGQRPNHQIRFCGRIISREAAALTCIGVIAIATYVLMKTTWTTSNASEEPQPSAFWHALTTVGSTLYKARLGILVVGALGISCIVKRCAKRAAEPETAPAVPVIPTISVTPPEPVIPSKQPQSTRNTVRRPFRLIKTGSDLRPLHELQKTALKNCNNALAKFTQQTNALASTLDLATEDLDFSARTPEEADKLYKALSSKLPKHAPHDLVEPLQEYRIQLIEALYTALKDVQEESSTPGRQTQIQYLQSQYTRLQCRIQIAACKGILVEFGISIEGLVFKDQLTLNESISFLPQSPQEATYLFKALNDLDGISITTKSLLAAKYSDLCVAFNETLSPSLTNNLSAQNKLFFQRINVVTAKSTFESYAQQKFQELLNKANTV